MEIVYTQQSRKISLIPWLMWGLGLGFTLLQFFTQLATGHMAMALSLDFKLDAVGLGYLSAAFFYTFIIMQIPAGMLLDRFGSKRVLIVALLCLTVGCWVFSSAHNLPMAYVGRMLMGLGSAFGFIGMLSLAAGWFTPNRFVFIVACSEMIAMVVVASGQFLMPSWVINYGWRQIIAACGIISGLLAVSYLVGIVEAPKRIKHSSSQRYNLLHAFYQTVFNKQAWLNGTASGLITVILTVFEALWGIPFLMKVHAFSPQQAGAGVAVVLLGIAFGAPIMGWWSNAIQKRCPVLLANAVGLGLILAILILLPNLPLTVVFALLFLLGITNSVYVLCYSIAREISLPQNQNAALGFVNMLTMSGSIVIQPLIGYVLDFCGNGKVVNGLPEYSIRDFQWAMAILPMCMLLSMIFIWVLKETHCKEIHCEEHHD